MSFGWPIAFLKITCFGASMWLSALRRDGSAGRRIIGLA